MSMLRIGSQINGGGRPKLPSLKVCTLIFQSEDFLGGQSSLSEVNILGMKYVATGVSKPIADLVYC